MGEWEHVVLTSKIVRRAETRKSSMPKPPKCMKEERERLPAMGRMLPNVWHQRRAQRVRCMPGLGGVVEVQRATRDGDNGEGTMVLRCGYAQLVL